MKSISLTAILSNYIDEHTPLLATPLAQLAATTDALSCAQLRTPNNQVKFIQFLINLLRPHNLLEIGTFTGFTTLAMALASPSTAKIITCDICDTYPKIGSAYWTLAGVAEKIEICLRPALETLNRFKKNGQMFDFIYIDADKKNYWEYFLLSIELLNSQGLIMVDNVLWRGEVANDHLSKQATAMHHFNTELSKRTDIFYSLLPIGDGITLISKKDI